MGVDLPELAARLQDAGLIDKSFLSCTKSEILQVVEAVLSSVGGDVPATGWQKPYLETTSDGKQRLVIPFDSHPDYHWWKIGGKSITETLIELEAPFEVAVNHISGLTPDKWANITNLPF